ncbi:MAG: phospho-N-acetylmuramoyl-pentapeptide-transferase [Lentisphaerales bacterium]|nr:MAG: phospho-N-acetylmuramoyl-pentapeptide-transferase [Lentisphaerales bacterium]
MFYYLYEIWSEHWKNVYDVLSPLRVFQYITVRAFCGAGTAFLLTVCLGPWAIRKLSGMNYRQHVRKDEAPSLGNLHGYKEGTPTMGGLLIILCVVVSTFLWAIPTNQYVLLTIATMCYMGGIGFIDDRMKVRQRGTRGLRARNKIILQLIWCVIVMEALLHIEGGAENVRMLMVPFMKDPLIARMSIPAAFVFLSLVMIGASNAVNLTDGLDGLAIGCSSSVAMSYLVMAYVAGHSVFAGYLIVPYVAGSGELAVFCGCLLGACFGFLWYNCHPAKVFMGDTGSLSLGGAIAMVAILVKQELVLVIVGGVFVIEALSVILQVISFKTTGKRLFAMAPIHHHFELQKWSETQVTVRFWILSMICALLGVLTLKIR